MSRTFVEFPSDTDFILTKLDAPSDGRVIISRRSGWDRPQIDTVQHDGAEQAEAFIDERSQALVASGAIEVAPARYLASPGGQHVAIHPPAGRWLGYRLGEGELARHFMELLDTPILAMKRYRERLEYWVEEERFRDVERTDRPGGSKIAYCERGMLRRVRTRHGRGANRTYLFRSDDGSCHCVEIREEGRIVEVFMKASHGWQRQRFDDPSTEDWTRCEFYDEAGFWATSAAYILRPETMESLYYAYRVTGDRKYQDMAWEAFGNMKEVAKAGSAYASVRDVTKADGGGNFDNMQSFWLAETLKYLYLIFAEESEVQVKARGKNTFVYNTEAHPVHVR